MLFNSFEFIIFFLIVVVLYYTLPVRFKLPLLFVASCIFYAVAVPIYLLVILATIPFNYFAALIINRTKNKRRKLFLIISILSNLLILAVFKYFNFFNENFTHLAKMAGFSFDPIVLNLILPIG